MEDTSKLIFKKGSDQVLSQYFRTHEFDCPCSEPDCLLTKIDPKLLKLLNTLRESIGSPLKIHSAFRCDFYQKDLALRGYETAKGLSCHQVGLAADCSSKRHTGPELATQASLVGFTSIGIASTWAHLDVRPGYRRWTYTR